MATATTGSSDERVLISLYRESRSHIFGLVYARCGDRQVAEDILAQTFETAARQFARHRGAEVTAAWLTTVAKRRLVDHWRRANRGRNVVSRLSGSLETAEPPRDVDPQLWSAVSSLSPNQRAVLVLRYVDDWSVAEIAEGLDLTYSAAESLLARARRSLRTALGDQEGTT